MHTTPQRLLVKRMRMDRQQPSRQRLFVKRKLSKTGKNIRAVRHNRHSSNRRVEDASHSGRTTMHPQLSAN